ncbi:MAG TPA: YceI family protein [Anaerolineae bacterium]|nr:YceI family protein [Anaerolineae bacterium]
MNKNLLAVAFGVGVLVLGVVVYLVLGPTEEASAPIEAEPIALDATNDGNNEAEMASDEEMSADDHSDDSMADDSMTDDSMTNDEMADDSMADDEMADDSMATDTDTATTEETNTADVGTLTIYSIDPEQSEVRFVLDELLRGEPFTVVGSSNQVAGEIAVNLADLSATQLGTITINARTFATDSGNRDRAIRNRILNTDSFEFITFVPTEIIGLAGSAAVGDTIEFEVVGDLTIRDVTLSERFTVSATVDSDTQISGSANSIISRSDYGLTIPSVSFVAEVDEEVQLEIDFVAPAK